MNNQTCEKKTGMNDPLISIIIPIYNVEKYLHQCLESVINQSYKNLEIILIDDGSIDKSPQVCDYYSKSDERIKLYHRTNNGISESRNFGINVSTGDYLMFIDSDDWIDPNSCEFSVKYAIDCNADIVFWSYKREYTNLSLPKRIATTQNSYTIYEKEKVENELERRLVGLLGIELKEPEQMDSLTACWAKLYKKEIIISNRFEFVSRNEIGYHEDGLFNLFVFNKCKKAVYIDLYLYHYRRSLNTSITAKFNPYLTERGIVLYNKIAEFILKNHPNNNKFQIAFNNRIAFGIVGLGLNICNSSISFGEKKQELLKIISTERYKIAYKTLSLKYFPLPWKVFFIFAKINFATGLLLLLNIIKRIITR